MVRPDLCQKGFAEKAILAEMTAETQFVRARECFTSISFPVSKYAMLEEDDLFVCMCAQTHKLLHVH